MDHLPRLGQVHAEGGRVKKEQLDAIVQAHKSGMPCSRIDESLGLPPNTAHLAIVNEWVHGRLNGRKKPKGE